jgi:hypothetical protein
MPGRGDRGGQCKPTSERVTSEHGAADSGSAQCFGESIEEILRRD